MLTLVVIVSGKSLIVATKPTVFAQQQPISCHMLIPL